MFTLNTFKMVAQSTSKQEALRIRICQFRKTHQNFSKSFTVKHFSEEGVPRSTIYRVLQGNADFLNPKRKKGSGRIPKIMTDKAVKQLKVMVDHKHGVTQAQLGRHFKCDQSFINKTLKRKTTIKYRKKKKIPDRNESQLQRIKPLCRYLYRNFRNLDFILDDESYFTLANTHLPANSGFYTSDMSKTPNDVKYKKQPKFEKKVLVSLINFTKRRLQTNLDSKWHGDRWQAVCTKPQESFVATHQ